MKQKPSFLKVACYLFVKYIVFFIVLIFLDNPYKIFLTGNNKQADFIATLFSGYFLEIMFATFILAAILFIPLYVLFKLKTPFLILRAFVGLIIIEYFIYEATCSYIHFDVNGIVNGSISILFFSLFFGKFIWSLNSTKSLAGASM